MIRLRPWLEADIQVLPSIANNVKIWNNLRDYFPSPYTIVDAIEWITYNKEMNVAKNLAIEYDGKLVGGVSVLPGQDIHSKNAEIGYWVAEPHWNKGIASIAVGLLVSYAFENFGCKRIYAGVFEYNKASMKILVKNGFEREAILKKAVYKNGLYWDEHIYSIVR